MAKKRNVADIIDIEYLQMIQDNIGIIMGITTALLDPNGVPITNPTNLHAFCAMMQASKDGVKMCITTNLELIRINMETKDTAVVTCPNSGLKTAAVPIFIRGEYLGSWLIGQIRMDDIDYDLIEDTAIKAGFSKEKAKENIAKLPIVTNDQFFDILKFLDTSTKVLADLVDTNDTINQRNQDLEKITHKLERTVKTFSEFINLSDIGTYLVDFYTGELIMYNKSYQKIMELTDEEIEKGRATGKLEGKDFYITCTKDELLFENGEIKPPYQWEYYYKNQNKWYAFSAKAMQWYDNRFVIMTTMTDITDKKKEESRIAFLAYNDQNLGIPNDIKLVEDLSHCDYDTTFMICFNTKGLGDVNNLYGRSTGDRLLTSIISWFSTWCNDDLVLYREKGKDFVLLLKNHTEESAIAIAEKINTRFGAPWLVDLDGFTQKIYSGVDIGVMKTNEKPESLSNLLNSIEMIINFARKENKIMLYNQEMEERFKKDSQLSVSLKSCILNNMEGFSLNYQPIVDPNTDKWVAMEALCRWKSPHVGMIRPDIFIAEAERLGLIGILTDWVLEEALRTVKEWGLSELPHFYISVNLSPLQLKNRMLTEEILKIIEKYDFPKKKLSLEITENNEVHFDNSTKELLNLITSNHIALSLDDFGIGYATFSSLKNLPLTTLKTDRSFVFNIENDEFQKNTMRIMVEYAHAAGLKVVAEGVETKDQRDIVLASGVNLIQGYYYSKPLTKEAVKKNLYKYFG